MGESTIECFDDLRRLGTKTWLAKYLKCEKSCKNCGKKMYEYYSRSAWNTHLDPKHPLCNKFLTHVHQSSFESVK